MRAAAAVALAVLVVAIVYVATRPRATAADIDIRGQLGVKPGGDLEARMTGTSGGTAAGAHRGVPSVATLVESGRLSSPFALPSGEAMGIAAI